MHGNQLESMSILHIKDESGERERMLSLNGEAREVIRDNKNLICIWPDSRKVMVDDSNRNTFSPLFVPSDIVKTSKYYDMKLAGGERIAGHDTVIVNIEPRDEFRYGLSLWLNSSNGLLLKSNLVNEKHQVVEQVMFTRLEVLDKSDPIPLITMPELDDSFSLVRYHNGSDSGTLEADKSWRISYLPEGFWQESALKRKIAGTDRYIQQMVYTDGLASLSVFIEKQTAEETPQGETSMGAVNAFISLFKDYSVTAIGEVPAMTVRLVAESISNEKL